MILSVSDISQVGISALSLFGGFLKKIAPPEGAARIWTGFASLIAGIGFLSVKLLTHMSATPRSIKLWGALALGSVVLSLLLCFFYLGVRQSYTVEYAAGFKIAGTEYTDAARKHLTDSPNLTRAQLLLDFAGDTSRIWTDKSLMRARLTLGGLYSLFIASLAFGLNLAIEVLNRM